MGEATSRFSSCTHFSSILVGLHSTDPSPNPWSREEPVGLSPLKAC